MCRSIVFLFISSRTLQVGFTADAGASSLPTADREQQSVRDDGASSTTQCPLSDGGITGSTIAGASVTQESAGRNQRNVSHDVPNISEGEDMRLRSQRAVPRRTVSSVYMSAVPSQVYTRQLLPQKFGYPLLVPEPSDSLPSRYRRKGVRIGDIGVIKLDGSFHFAFSLCRAADHPINRRGVPEGFEPIDLGRGRTTRFRAYHEKGSEVMSTSMRKEDISVSGAVTENR